MVEGPGVGEGVGGTTVGVAGGTRSRGVRWSFAEGVGDENSDIRGVGLESTPRVLISTPSFKTKVPSLSKAASKSISVLEIRRVSRPPFADTGCKPDGYAEAGAVVRGAFRNMEARVGRAKEAEQQ
jgi:hypothetical protein